MAEALKYYPATQTAAPLYLRINMAAQVGFEPTHDGIKIRCLTTWRLGYIFVRRMFSSQLFVAAPEGFEPTMSRSERDALPLGYGAISLLTHLLNWQPLLDLNQRLSASKTDALGHLAKGLYYLKALFPVPSLNLADTAGLEPATPWLTAKCSTN
jgi:hypothetical protein